jgi:putative Mg2+ transporter-C (MgtC) family protein
MIASKIILLRLALAALFGALIGLERERKNWTAGLRTHMMVCVGACLIMIVSAFGFSDILSTPNVTLDPSRIAAQVVSGIGFIGAGTILYMKQGTVHGLTTAAGLWTVAAIGLATGGGLYLAAASTTIIALLILWALLPLEHYYSKKFTQKSIRIVTHQNLDNNNLLKNLWNQYDLKIKNFSLEKTENTIVLLVNFDNADDTKLETIIDELKNNPEILEISYTQ